MQFYLETPKVQADRFRVNVNVDGKQVEQDLPRAVLDDELLRLEAMTGELPQKVADLRGTPEGADLMVQFARISITHGDLDAFVLAGLWLARYDSASPNWSDLESFSGVNVNIQGNARFVGWSVLD